MTNKQRDILSGVVTLVWVVIVMVTLAQLVAIAWR